MLGCGSDHARFVQAERVSTVLTLCRTIVLILYPANTALAVMAFAGACLFSVPARASTSYCSSLTPTSTNCAAVDTNVSNPGLDAVVNTFDGTFTADDNIQVFEIDVTAPDTTLTIQSFGYGGGTDLAGNVISIPPNSPDPDVPLAGMATTFSLYSSSGTWLGNSLATGCGLGQTNPNTGDCYDASLTAVVGVGTDYLVLTENNNFSNGGNLFTSADVNPLSFNMGGTGNFTSEFAAGFCAAPFCDPQGNQTNGDYSLDIAASVPEPSSFTLVALGLVLPLAARWLSRGS